PGIRDRAVSHLEVLPFGKDVPRPASPLRVGAPARGGEVAGLGFARKIISVAAIEIESPVTGNADAQPLPDRMTDATRPVPVLIRIGEAARIRRRGIGGL